jgi:hypothetical protein
LAFFLPVAVAAAFFPPAFRLLLLLLLLIRSSPFFSPLLHSPLSEPEAVVVVLLVT